MSQQPRWKMLTNLGDRSPIDYGGYFVYIDLTGVYPPEAELLEAPDNDEAPEGWDLYRFILEPCTLVNGVLSDNSFHPDHAAWFAQPEAEREARPQDTTYLSNVANSIGMTLEALQALFCSDRTIDRAHAYRTVGEYHGFVNLDSYPTHYTKRSALPRRIRRYDGR